MTGEVSDLRRRLEDAEGRVRTVEDTTTRMMTILERIDDSIERTEGYMRDLTGVQVRQEEDRSALSRAFGELREHDQRLRSIEQHIPGLRDARDWLRDQGGRIIVLLLVAGISSVATVLIS